MNEEAILTTFDTREQWLANRANGIGGSEAAAVLGLHPWMSPLALYCEKIGLTGPKDADSEAVEWGRILEPVIADQFVEKTGRQLVDPGPWHSWRNNHYPFMQVTVDRLIVPIGEEGNGDLSIKTASAYKHEDWKDEEIPLPYQIQLQYELLTTGMQWGAFAALIGGQRLELRPNITRNERFCACLLEKVEEFWDRIKRGDPPDPDGSASTTETLKRLYPKDNGEAIALPGEAMEWDERRAKLKAEIKEREAAVDEIDNRIKFTIGDAAFGLLPGGQGRYSYKSVPKAGYTVQPSESRQLRRLSK